jgi:hypothetical protein
MKTIALKILLHTPTLNHKTFDEDNGFVVLWSHNNHKKNYN